MKLRLRDLETKETLRLEIPSPCTLQQLQQTLSQSISHLPPPPSSSSSLYFSLNRKDALHASSPHDSLHSLGITSGDLIYFSLDPSSFSPPSQTQIPNSQESPTNLEMPRSKEESHQETQVQDLTDATDLDPNTHTQQENQEPEDCQDLTETMDVDGDDDDDGPAAAGKKFSEPYFLRRVLREELGGGGGGGGGGDGGDGRNHKLLVIAVHAVLLESGFVGFDSVTGLKVDRFQTAYTVSLRYTLPELLLGNVGETESVVLKFQCLGHFVNVYGSLDKGGSSLYWVRLDEDRFVPAIDLVWADGDKNDKMDDKDGSSKSYPENEVFQFWKIVKDGLALPLLIDLCDRTGLCLPACLIRLPTELKVKILESLPAVDVAKMGRVCREMRYLSSNDDLWKQKFAEEFNGEMGVKEMIPWKERFACSWESRKKRKRMISQRQGRVGTGSFVFPRRRDPIPFGSPPMMIGGDFDRLPGLGIPSPFGQPGRAYVRFRRNFSPPCNMGDFNA